MREDVVVGDWEVLTPRGGWEVMGWKVVGQMRRAAPGQTGWTASGALDWGFPHFYHFPPRMRALGGSGTTRRKLLGLGCGVNHLLRRTSGCRRRRYFLGLAADFLGFHGLQVVRSRPCAAAVDGVADGGGGGGGWIP